METLNLADFFLQGQGILLFKIPLLILLFLYSVFLFIVLNRIRAFNRVVHITSANASPTIQTFAVIHFVLSLSLFLLALVIV